MPRRNLLPLFSRVRALKEEINQFVPMSDVKATVFRADLAGLLVVLIAATYESCVKDSLTTFASQRNEEFGDYAARSYARLNSRIQISDLYRYARVFSPSAHNSFGKVLKKSDAYILRCRGRGLQTSYNQILSWRHDFAHEGIRNTTVEEAFQTHQAAKHVLYCFEEALNGP